MKFYKLIKDILNSLRMEKAEFQRLTGINPVNITWWEQHPDTLPQMKTIKRIEQGLGIVFEFDEEGRPTGWQKSDSILPQESAPIISTLTKEKVAPQPSYQRTAAQVSTTSSIPAAPDELYDMFDYYGDKRDWGELTSSDRQYYENLYRVLLFEVNEAESAYERAAEEASITRNHAIEDSMKKIRRAMLNYMLGDATFNANNPL